jgi:hypothetical protein
MKIAIGLALALACALSIAPASADDTFQAFSSMSTLEQASITPLSDEQLASVEGMAQVCIVCVQRARIKQVNYANNAAFFNQVNSAGISQSIND